MSVDGIVNAGYQAGSAMRNIASGSRINSAADDASGLAVSEKMESQIRGLEQGSNNARDMQNLINTAEGGLNNISDILQRLRELALQAGSGILTDGDRRIIQNEIEQFLDEISQTADRVQFNNISLLNGGANELHTASSPDGSGPTVSIPDIRGLLDDVINNLNVVTNRTADSLSLIDGAISGVNAVRAELGAMSNRMDHTVNSNSITLLNQMAAKSQAADADFGREAMALHREQILNDMRILMQRQQQDDEQRKTQLIM
jgi:flagellin